MPLWRNVMASPFPGVADDVWDDLAEARRMEQFLFANQSPRIWLHVAARHKRAADILYEVGFAASERDLRRILNDEIKSGPLNPEQMGDQLDLSLISDYLLLIGYALENCFKGCLLGRDPALVASGKLDGFVQGHNLCALADKCGISLSAEEREMLDLVARYVVWGKYAAPLAVKDMPSPILTEDQYRLSLAISNPYINRRAQVMLNAVFDRAAKSLSSAAPPS